MAKVQRDGEGYDDRQRRREEAVAAAWQKGRADPRVAGELDQFFAAASQRLGEEGERAASRAASSGRRMELPGIGREHQDGLDELARHFVQVRDGVTFNARWKHRVEQQAKEAARWQARQEERERRGCLASRSRTASGRGKAANWGWENKRQARAYPNDFCCCVQQNAALNSSCMARPRGIQKPVRVTASLEARDFENLRQLASRSDTSIAWIVRRAVKEFISRSDPDQPPPRPDFNSKEV